MSHKLGTGFCRETRTARVGRSLRIAPAAKPRLAEAGGIDRDAGYPLVNPLESATSGPPDRTISATQQAEPLWVSGRNPVPC